MTHQCSHCKTIYHTPDWMIQNMVRSAYDAGHPGIQLSCQVCDSPVEVLKAEKLDYLEAPDVRQN